MKSSFKVWETNGKSKFQRWKLNPIILNQVETLQSSNKLAFLPVFPIHPTNILKYYLKHSILYPNLLHIFNNVGTWKKLDVLLFFVFVGSWRGLPMYCSVSFVFFIVGSWRGLTIKYFDLGFKLSEPILLNLKVLIWSKTAGWLSSSSES